MGKREAIGKDSCKRKANPDISYCSFPLYQKQNMYLNFGIPLFRNMLLSGHVLFTLENLE